MKGYHLTILLATCGLSGCHQGPQRVVPPAIDASRAASAAIALYDRNGDGLLDSRELQACPGILSALGKYDADGDEKVSADEIADRIRVWSQERAALTSYFCRVLWNGRPLSDADVLFEPESFLGEAIKPARGKTQTSGHANLEIAMSDLPPGLPASGVHLGLYKVRITHPKLQIPKRYNTETILGHEVVLGRDSAGPADFSMTGGE
ncbi:MAG TPA: hypothetical protein PJ982_03985 [Lacipirellulaceae bacterium]|nr:hypothetical protein [Lacipirellulaceae bacterium]